MGLWFPHRPGISSKPLPPPPPKPKAAEAIVYAAPDTPWSGLVDWLITHTIISGISAVTTIASVLGVLRAIP